jgi:hypothetical protein
MVWTETAPTSSPAGQTSYPGRGSLRANVFAFAPIEIPLPARTAGGRRDVRCLGAHAEVGEDARDRSAEGLGKPPAFLDPRDPERPARDFSTSMTPILTVRPVARTCLTNQIFPCANKNCWLV